MNDAYKQLIVHSLTQDAFNYKKPLVKTNHFNNFIQNCATGFYAVKNEQETLGTGCLCKEAKKLFFMSKGLLPIEALLTATIQNAYHQKMKGAKGLTNSFRLIHHANDFLPYVLIDYFNKVYTLTTLHPVWDNHINRIHQALHSLNPTAILLKNHHPQRAKLGYLLTDQVLSGALPQDTIQIYESGFSYQHPLLSLQHFNLQQRALRLACNQFVKDYAPKKILILANESSQLLANENAAYKKNSIYLSNHGQQIFQIHQGLRQIENIFDLLVLDLTQIALNKNNQTGMMHLFISFMQKTTPNAHVAFWTRNWPLAKSWFKLAATKLNKKIKIIKTQSSAFDYPNLVSKNPTLAWVEVC